MSDVDEWGIAATGAGDFVRVFTCISHSHPRGDKNFEEHTKALNSCAVSHPAEAQVLQWVAARRHGRTEAVVQPPTAAPALRQDGCPRKS